MTEIVKKSWRPGLITWLIIAGLILINASVFISFDASNVRLMQWLYTLNPRCWPVWYAWSFWLLVAGIWSGLLLKAFRHIKSTKLVILTSWLAVGLIFFYSSLFCKMLRIQAYYVLTWCLNIPYVYFYKPYIYIPLTEFSATGTFSWKLLILPILGITGVLLLLHWGHRKKIQTAKLTEGES